MPRPKQMELVPLEGFFLTSKESYLGKSEESQARVSILSHQFLVQYEARCQCTSLWGRRRRALAKD